MVPARNGSVLREIRRLFTTGTTLGLTDGQLLERFTSGDQEAAEMAFTAIVERHGPMVFRVCRSVLRERHDAEDAFQATFLILVRKAGSIRKQSSVASWLHGVALRVAHCQRGAAARHRKHEQRAAETEVATADDEDRRELASVLHEELDRLPEKYRAPIVLCYFDSLSHEQAAALLCWPVGTVRSRLARGRERLRSRLVRRGFAPSISLLKRAIPAETAGAALPSRLSTTTARAALQYASSEWVLTGATSKSVALLVEGAMHMMFLTKMRFALVAVGLIGSSVIALAQQAGSSLPQEATRATSAAAAGNHAANAPIVAGDDEAAVAREMGRIDVALLTQEVHDIRDEVQAALREKLRAERTNSPDLKAAQRAFESARSSYLTLARELHSAQRRFDRASERHEPAPPRSAGHSTASDDGIIRDPLDHQPARHFAAAAIGSIDLDAVFQRSEKFRPCSEEFNQARLARSNKLAKMLSEVQIESQILEKFAPGSVDRKKRELRVTDLKARYEAERVQSELVLARRQAKTIASLYGEIQQIVAALAKERGLAYVIKITAGPKRDADPNDVQTAMNASVVYADPKNDLTELVIAEMNRRYSESE